MATIIETIKKFGVKRLADQLGVTKGAVSQWKQVPLKRVFEVERITGIPPHEQRPDVFPETQQSADKTSTAA